MKTPFPGMDPYLEHHTIWPDVHNRLIIALADELSPVVAPNYYIGVESRAYVIKPEGDQFLGRPDISIVAPFGAMPATAVALPVGAEVAEVEMPAPDEISHYYLEVRSVHSHELITLIELLSPVNKIDAEGRLMYMRQRYETLASCTSLIEIDLLRAGEPLPPKSKTPSYYRTLVSRGWTRRKAQLFTFNLRTRIPDFPLPLEPHEPEPLVPLNEILHALYTRARFDLRIDYGRSPLPALAPEDAEWAAQLLQSE